MRLVEFSKLVPGMVVGQPLYGPSGEILCREGTCLKESYLRKLAEYSIPHLYISDELSEGIEIQCTVSAEVKNEAYRSVKRLYTAIRSKKGSYHEEMQACLNSVDKITEDVIAEKINLFDLFDIKMMNEYIYQHPVNVAIISLILGKSLELSSLELYRLAVGAILLDVGNNFIPQEILHKEGTYTDEDIKIMQTHTEQGYHFAKDEFYLPMKSYLAILQHHERYDGTGYPNKKVGKDISSYGRIVAIADVYDALSSHKPYREALTPANAFKTVIQGAGSQFDPDYIRIFANRVSPYPVGFTLQFPDHRSGIVIKNYEGRPFNPSVRIIEENAKILDHPYVIEL